METNNAEFAHFKATIANNTSHDKIMYLSIFVDSNDTILKELYINAANKHNQKIIEDPHFYDAGFDLFLPKNDIKTEGDGQGTGAEEREGERKGEEERKGTQFFSKNLEQMHVNKVDFKVKCCAKIIKYNKIQCYTPFYTYARSSISKTPLRLANNQGIIDAGYRGNLIGMFDCIHKDQTASCDFYVDEYTRLLQICSPSLSPIYVEIVDKFQDLGPSTSRGDGGFGSTGK